MIIQYTLIMLLRMLTGAITRFWFRWEGLNFTVFVFIEVQIRKSMFEQYYTIDNSLKGWGLTRKKILTAIGMKRWVATLFYDHF